MVKSKIPTRKTLQEMLSLAAPMIEVVGLVVNFTAKVGQRLIGVQDILGDQQLLCKVESKPTSAAQREMNGMEGSIVILLF